MLHNFVCVCPLFNLRLNTVKYRFWQSPGACLHLENKNTTTTTTTVAYVYVIYLYNIIIIIIMNFYSLCLTLGVIR